METLNHPGALAQLRAEQIKMPLRKVETSAIKLFGMKVCLFDKHRTSLEWVGFPWSGSNRETGPETWSAGSAPSDTFWDDGELFIEKRGLEPRNTLFHEICHYIVAHKGGKLDKPNWGLEEFGEADDEVESCKLEFFLGFMSGAYSFKDTCSYIEDYCFDEEACLYDEVCFGEFYDYRDPTPAEVKQRFVNFIYECAKVAKTYPLARKLAKEMGISFTKKATKEKLR